jgi:hypothetical protein
MPEPSLAVGPRHCAVLAALAGAVIWLAIAAASGRAEAWDSPLYFQFGLPLAVLVSAVLGWLVPERPWRWSMILMTAQWAAMALTAPVGTLWPLGLVAFLVLAVPGVIAATLAARLRRGGAGRLDGLGR